jgi:tetratricopeptide (TPR) repeat protein
MVLALVSLLLTTLVLGLIEGACRLAGYGGYRPTFVDAGQVDDGSTLVFTDHGGPNSYFFSNRSNPGSLDPTAFIMPKPPKTFRVFIVGESAAKGNPYVRPLTAGAFLKEMLGDLWPDRHVEVINLGVTAVASYPVLGITTEALDYEPDLIVAYLGNNEFYGAYGVASLHSAGRSPGMIRLLRATRSLGIAQLIDDLRPAANADGSRTLMEAMVGQTHIGADDPLRASAAQNLETFVGEMIDRCAERGIPLLVCTPPANERDLAPLGGGADATEQYQKAQALLAENRFDESARAFQRALDLDGMPWRPPSTSVDAIKSAVQSRNALLCDVEAAFRAASHGGSIGWELMDDHVHASLRGQELIARSIVRALTKAPSAVAVATERVEALPDWSVYAERLGANDYERFAASHAMRLLAGIAFFRQTNPGFLEHHEAICQRIERDAPLFARLAIQQWLDVTTHATAERPISGWVAEACLQNGAYDKAVRLFRLASRAVTPYGNWDLEYTYKSLMAQVRAGHALSPDELDVALKAIGRARCAIRQGKNQSGGPELWAGLFHQIRGELEPSIEYLAVGRRKLPPESRVAADEALVRAYRATGRLDLAKPIIDDGLQGPHAAAYQAMLRN